MIIPFKYILLESAGPLMIAATKEGKNLLYGLINKKDHQIIPFKYSGIEMIHPDLFCVKDSTHRLKFVNSKGKFPDNNFYDHFEILENNMILTDLDGKYGLVDDKGKLLLHSEFKNITLVDSFSLNVLPFTEWKIIDHENNINGLFYFDKMEPVNFSIYKVSINGNETFMDRKGMLIRIPDEIKLVEFLEESAVCRRNRKFGLISFDGAIMIEPEYDKYIINNPFIFFNKQSNGWSVFNYSDHSWIDEYYEQIHLQKTGRLCYKQNGFWGMMDWNGKRLIEAKFDSIIDTGFNYLEVLFYGESGIIDQSGQWIVPPQKATIEILTEDEYLFRNVYGSWIKKFDGTVIYATVNKLYRKGNILIEDDWNGLYGIVNMKYKKILPVKNYLIKELIADSIFLFYDDYGWGAVGEDGRILFEQDNRFQKILNESEGFLGVKIDGKYGFVDTRGRLRISNRYEDIGIFHESMAPVKILNKWGFVDKLEQLKIQPHYDSVASFINGLSIVKKDNKYGLIDMSGTRLLELEYDSIFRSSHDSFIVYFAGKYGLADKTGKIKLFSKFEEINDLGNGFIIVKRKDKEGLISDEGVTIIPQIYDKIIYDQYAQSYICGVKSKWKSYLLENIR